jgi:hypothetical protein
MPALFARRTLWWPTRLGWALGLGGLLAAILGWWFGAEAFLQKTDRRSTEALIVEGWIGIEGVRAAKEEYERGGYRYIISSGGLTSNRWGTRRWSYAEEAQKLLLRLGVPADRIILAPAPDTDSQRTYTTAAAVREKLATLPLQLASADVFTLGVHARRSRLVFAKTLAGVDVGVISWKPKRYGSGRWWQSSERSADLLKETVGYTFELVFNSGRLSNSAPSAPQEVQPD